MSKITESTIYGKPALSDDSEDQPEYWEQLEEIKHAQEQLQAVKEGQQLLNDIYNYLGRFVAYPDDNCRIAHTLWITHTHLMDCWESTPRLAFLSPEPASGKTRALEITENLVPKPVVAVNVTPAYLFRKVGDPDGPPTILYDEIDTVFGPKAKENEELRGLLNAGHRRGAVAGRCVVYGKTVKTEEIPAYSAVALAGIGELPDTIITRSIVIRMRRRKSTERVEPYRRRLHAPEGEALRDRLVDWAKLIESELAGVFPEMPEGVNDRDADLWEPLIAIADVVGGDWPDEARVTAVTLVTLSKESTPSLGIRLLSDIRNVTTNKDKISTEKLIKELVSLDEAPWGDLYGKQLNARGLAQRLKKYNISSKTIRICESTAKGYEVTDFYDAWQRYLPVPSRKEVTGVTKVTTQPTEDYVSFQHTDKCSESIV